MIFAIRYQYFGLTLSTSEIDEIMSKDYKNEKVVFQKKRKKYFITKNNFMFDK